MAENYEGINVSSGINQGLAQVFSPFQTQYDMGEIGQFEYKNRLAQQEAAAKKQEKLSKLTADIKTPLMPPDYLKLFDKTRKELLEYAKKGDLDMVSKLKGDLENIGMLGKSISDNSRAVGNTILQQPAGSFEGVDILDEITKGGKDINLTNIYDVSTDYMNRLQGVKRKEKPFEQLQFIGDLQGVRNEKVQGNRTTFDDDQAADLILSGLATNPQAVGFYEKTYKSNPDLQKKYANHVEYAVETLKPNLVIDNVGKQSKGGLTINNIMPNENQQLQGTSKPVVQNIKIARGFGTGTDDQGNIVGYGKTTESVPLNVVTLPNRVTLGTAVWPNGTIQVDASGNIKDISGEPADKETTFGQFAGDTYVATKTVSKTVNGETFTINAGEIVDPEKIKRFKNDTGIDIPYREQPIALIQSGNGFIYTGATPYGEPVGLSYFNTKGQTPKGEAVEKGIKTVKTTGNKKKTVVGINPVK